MIAIQTKNTQTSRRTKSRQKLLHHKRRHPLHILRQSMMAAEAADTVAIPMPAIPATRAIPALRITTALTITPDRRPPVPAADQARRAVLQAPRIPARLVRHLLVRRRPVRRHPAPVPVRQALRLLAPAHRPGQVTVRRRNPPRHRIQAAGLHNKLWASSSRSSGN